MSNKEQGISDIAHAWIHRYKNKFSISNKMKASEFILQNKGAIKAIYEQLRTSYNFQRTKELDKCFKKGVEAFLRAEGMLA